MSNGKKSTTVSVSGLFSTLLQIAFIVLKLCHVIEWSWLWVLAPTWIPLIIALLIFGIIALWVTR